MLTKTELQKILDQVNQRFDHQNKRIQKLEEELVSLQKPKRTTATKKVDSDT